MLHFLQDFTNKNRLKFPLPSKGSCLSLCSHEVMKWKLLKFCFLVLTAESNFFLA